MVVRLSGESQPRQKMRRPHDVLASIRDVGWQGWVFEWWVTNRN